MHALLTIFSLSTIMTLSVTAMPKPKTEPTYFASEYFGFVHPNTCAEYSTGGSIKTVPEPAQSADVMASCYAFLNLKTFSLPKLKPNTKYIIRHNGQSVRYNTLDSCDACYMKYSRGTLNYTTGEYIETTYSDDKCTQKEKQRV